MQNSSWSWRHSIGNKSLHYYVSSKKLNKGKVSMLLNEGSWFGDIGERTLRYSLPSWPQSSLTSCDRPCRLVTGLKEEGSYQTRVRAESKTAYKTSSLMSLWDLMGSAKKGWGNGPMSPLGHFVLDLKCHGDWREPLELEKDKFYNHLQNIAKKRKKWNCETVGQLASVSPLRKSHFVGGEGEKGNLG